MQWRVLPLWGKTLPSFFRTARCKRRAGKANDSGDDSSNEHPDGFVGWGSSEEPGNVGTERVYGGNPEGYEHNAPNYQCKRNGVIHNGLSQSFFMKMSLIIDLPFMEHLAFLCLLENLRDGAEGYHGV